MTQPHSPFDPQAMARTVPRYTSYPTAPNFGSDVTGETYQRWLGELDRQTKLSLYLHIPFCDDLCWFCACRTQGAKRYTQVERYLSHLVREIELVANELDGPHEITQIHLGGGSPTILHPEDLLRLLGVLRRHLPETAAAELAVEIDPRDMTEPKLDALAEAGLGRASIGVQDFDPAVQAAIGRRQSWEMTRDVVLGLRRRGVKGINVDFLYGLPEQDCDTLARTIDQVITLRPDRIALFGYAHVPWMARRQKMIDPARLPDSAMRQRQAGMAMAMLCEAGYCAIGIDHFARPDDSLATAAADGTVRRNFQGYTVDAAEALIGFGASAISCLPQGYAQNDASTMGYQLRIEAGKLAAKRGHHLTLEDRMRRDVIEQLLCHFAVDWRGLRARYGDFTGRIEAEAKALIARAPLCAIDADADGFRVTDRWRGHARLIAAEFDTYLTKNPTKHSLAI